MDSFRAELGKDLARGIFPKTDSGQQVIDQRAPVLLANAEIIILCKLLQRDVMLARFLFEQPPADLDRLLTLLDVDPVLDFVSCARGLDVRQPVTSGGLAGLGDDF